MENKYINFNETRLQIFGELVKRYWNGSLISIPDLEALVDEIKHKYGFEDKEVPFIKDHVRIALGLNPNEDINFTNELDIVKNSSEISPPIVSHIKGPCEYCEEYRCECSMQQKYESETYIRSGPVIIDDECTDCGKCVSSCDFGAIADKIEFIPLINILKNKDIPVYATVAPAIAGQLDKNITLGQLRTAFKMLGFEDMIEVALFADLLTIKEAFEFNNLVKSEEDFFLTSCCCPVWFNMVKIKYPDIYEHLSPSVSPMIASGRVLKELYPKAKVVFIGPCIAKKSEALDPNLKDAIDFVLNFQEVQEIFKVLNISVKDLPAEDKDQASYAGRIYARTGGVSFSVKSVLNRLAPHRVIKLKAVRVDGVKNCKQILNDLREGRKVFGNFIEGMGCKGGCVGGPKTISDSQIATMRVNEFGEDSAILTPFDNLNVMKILRQLGVNSIESIMDNKILTKILFRS